MKIQILGAHMFESKTTRLSSILIDGTLAVDAGGLTSSLTFPEQRRIKHILLTHGHYDHIRDIPAFALKHRDRTTIVYAAEETLHTLTAHFMNGTVYPKFTEYPSAEKPAVRCQALEPLEPFPLGEYTVLAVPVNHSIPAWGYQIMDRKGRAIFFSGDTGPGLHSCWKRIAPQILIMDMGFSNKSAEIAPRPGHLSPRLLGVELEAFHRIWGYFPGVIVTHLNPDVEEEVQKESMQLAGELGIEIRLAHEGMIIEVGG